MVHKCPFVKWSGFQMEGWKLDKNVCLINRQIIWSDHSKTGKKVWRRIIFLPVSKNYRASENGWSEYQTFESLLFRFSTRWLLFRSPLYITKKCMRTVSILHKMINPQTSLTSCKWFSNAIKKPDIEIWFCDVPAIWTPLVQNQIL